MINHSLLKEYLQTNFPTELAEGDDGAIYAAMQATAPETKFVETWVTARTVMNTLGASAGAAFLDKLEAVAAVTSPVKWAMKFMEGTGIDVGSLATRAQLNYLADNEVGGITRAEVDPVIALAEAPQTIAERDGFAGLLITDISEAARGGNV